MLAFAPSLDVVERINSVLEPRGALHSDGRPSIRATPRDLVSILLDVDPRCFVIPAHAWTPWFGVYGSKSGFDSLEECFGDAWEHIPAIETGLSSDPAMNWRMPELDDRSIVSFSDAHSLPRMGRELTCFGGELSYDGLLNSLRGQDIAYTVEFFPEEGKYHHSGHRKCGVSLSPVEVAEEGGRCRVCGRRLTLGVMQRVDDLARRDVRVERGEDGLVRSKEGRPPFRSMVALDLILAEALGVGVKTKKVARAAMGRWSPGWITRCLSFWTRRSRTSPGPPESVSRRASTAFEEALWRSCRATTGGTERSRSGVKEASSVSM